MRIAKWIPWMPSFSDNSSEIADQEHHRFNTMVLFWFKLPRR